MFYFPSGLFGLWSLLLPSFPPSLLCCWSLTTPWMMSLFFNSEVEKVFQNVERSNVTENRRKNSRRTAATILSIRCVFYHFYLITLPPFLGAEEKFKLCCLSLDFSFSSEILEGNSLVSLWASSAASKPTVLSLLECLSKEKMFCL